MSGRSMRWCRWKRGGRPVSARCHQGETGSNSQLSQPSSAARDHRVAHRETCRKTHWTTAHRTWQPMTTGKGSELGVCGLEPNRRESRANSALCQGRLRIQFSGTETSGSVTFGHPDLPQDSHDLEGRELGPLDPLPVFSKVSDRWEQCVLKPAGWACVTAQEEFVGDH